MTESRAKDGKLKKAVNFDALKKIGYSGGISCECGWPNRKDKDAFYAARVKALAVMKKFAGQA